MSQPQPETAPQRKLPGFTGVQDATIQLGEEVAGGVVMTFVSKDGSQALYILGANEAINLANNLHSMARKKGGVPTVRAIRAEREKTQTPAAVKQPPSDPKPIPLVPQTFG